MQTDLTPPKIRSGSFCLPSLVPTVALLLLFTLVLCTTRDIAQAFSSGPKFAGTQTACTFDICGYSTGPNNNQCSGAAAGSQILSLTNFVFALPSSVTSIDGIVVEPKATQDSCANPSIQLLKNGTPTGSAKTFTPAVSSACANSTFVSVGSSTDKWGATLTRNDINASGFGVKITSPAFCGYLGIDTVRIKVFFSIATPVCGDGFITTPEQCDDGDTNGGDGCSAKCQAESALDSGQQKCVATLNTDGVNVVNAQSKVNASCIQASAAALELDPQACLSADGKGIVQKATDKVTADANDWCEPPPPFGFTSDTAINTTAKNQTIKLIGDVFGPDLNPFLYLKSTDKAKAGCQLAMAKAAQNLLLTKAKVFLGCKKSGIKVTADQQMLSGADLEACFDALNDDEKGTIAKAVTKISTTVNTQCAGLALAPLFPGQCSSALDFAACVDEQAECRVCRLFNGMDGLSENCDLFDDGMSNASCP